MSKAKWRKAQPRSFNWSYEQEVKLIELTRENPCLWDSRSPYYHRKQLRQTKLTAIAAGIHPDLTGDAVQARFRNIRIVFARELHKHLDSIRSGMGTEDVFKSKYIHFTRMMFIKDLLNISKSRSARVTADDNSSVTTESSLVSGDPTVDDVLDGSETGKGKMNMMKSQVSKQNELVSRAATVVESPITRSDADEIFCQLLANELKEMPCQKRDYAKLEIMRLLYNIKYNLVGPFAAH